MAAAQLTAEERRNIIETARGLLESGRSLFPSSGASKWALGPLEDVVDGSDQLECVICLDQQQAEQDQEESAAGWKEMPRGQRFLGGYLEKWLREHGACPSCRHPLTPPAPEITRAEQNDIRYNWFVAAQDFLQRVGQLLQ